MRGPIAVIGAGIAGLAAARTLADAGFGIQVYEKSRGSGGRAATRRLDRFQFDHGAQYFTARSQQFRIQVARLLDVGSVAAWTPRIFRLTSDGTREPTADAERFVGVPGMSSLGRALAGDLSVTRGSRISTLRRSGRGGWTPVSADGDLLEPVEAVIISCPAPQAAEVLHSASSVLAAECRSAQMLPCWAAMAAFESPLGLDLDAAFVTDGTLAWVSREASKPGRMSRPECWTLHGSPKWSAMHLEDEADNAAGALLSRFFEFAGLVPREPVTLLGHRWRFARGELAARGNLVDPGARLAVAGDWTRGNRLEDAWLSGIEAANSIAGLLGGC